MDNEVRARETNESDFVGPALPHAAPQNDRMNSISEPAPNSTAPLQDSLYGPVPPPADIGPHLPPGRPPQDSAPNVVGPKLPAHLEFAPNPVRPSPLSLPSGPYSRGSHAQAFIPPPPAQHHPTSASGNRVFTPKPPVEPPPSEEPSLPLQLQKPDQTAQGKDWLMYRTKEGDLYFSDPQGTKVQWERPKDCALQAAVNDRESWLAYRSDNPVDEGAMYYENKITGEVTWFQNPECVGLQPVNVPDSWIGFKLPNGKIYFHNMITKETSWHKPSYCTDIENMNITSVPDKKPDNAFKDTTGTSFVIPDFDSDSDSDSGGDAQDESKTKETENDDRSEIENMDRFDLHADKESAKILEIDKEYKSIIKQTRDDSKSKAIESEYFNLLREHDLKPYSQWTTWMPKLARDKRFHSVPIEDRVRLFTTHIQKLTSAKTGNQADATSRIKSVRKLLKHLKDDPIASTVLSKRCRKAKEIVTALMDLNKTAKSESLNQILQLLQTLDAKQQKKAVKPYLKDKN
mmetsp:Transcript_19801/g.25657  ORF Transcript_19801/g.25657 Transcript_19801/m.25657 type:complete len:517 (+) Transcript_19801:213-1763(+)